MKNTHHKRKKFMFILTIGFFIVFSSLGIYFTTNCYSSDDISAVKLQESLQTAYKNYVSASAQYGTESQEAKFWFDKYQEFAKQYSDKIGTSEQIQVQQAAQYNGSSDSGTTKTVLKERPNILKRIGYQFVSKLKLLLQKAPSHINDFALGEMNFVTGNYKDALTLYEMAERKGDLNGTYFYQSIYWQGRCYLEMAKNSNNKQEQIEYYKKAQERFMNVSMNLLVQKKSFNQQQKMYEKDSTALVVQIKNYINYLGTPTANSNQQANNKPTQPSTSSINSSLVDNSWKTSLQYDYLISDQAFVDVNSMTKDQIQSFLSSKNSVLSRPVDGKYPADMIYEAAQKYGISPKVLLARLQTEQGLVTKKSATQKELDWALGCGAYDGGNWNQNYKGLEKQIEGSAQTLRKHYNIGLTKISEDGTVKKEIDGETITIKNAASYSQYMYTPHKSGNKLYHSVYVGFFE